MVLMLAATASHAGRGKPCDSCESCTEMLSTPGVEVAASRPLTASGTCVTIRGEGATFDGSRHHIQAGTAVSIEADDVLVRHLRAGGGERAVRVTGARATLLDVAIAEGKVGIHADGAADLRVVRSRIERAAIGIAFGRVPSTGCAAGDHLRSPGAVLQRVEITGSGVGIAACEATPLVMESTITGNGTGWVQGAAPPSGGAKAVGPHDPCICAPSLGGVAPGTTLLYSSGCSGSLYHEGLLPDVRAQGHDINLRVYGREDRAETAVYDAFVRRCAPEISDAIGIPGCMPNYACIANGEVSKLRGDDDRLVVEHRLGAADDVAGFAARCVSAAETHYGEDRCRSVAMRGTTLCNNDTDLATKRAMGGASNACAGLEGMDCRPCDAPPPAAPEPAPVQGQPDAPAAAQPARQAAPEAPSEVAADTRPAVSRAATAEQAASRPDEPAPSRRSNWWLPLVILPLGAAAGVGLARRG